MTAKASTDLFSFTERIDESFDMTQKVRMVEQMWKVAYADGRLSEDERHVVWRVADLLHVPHAAYIHARLRAQEAAGLHSCNTDDSAAAPHRAAPRRTRRTVNRLEALLDKNRQWARKMEVARPGFFTSLLQQQAPQYLWIGCADSRVPANDLVDLAPGELFVHRNVANVVVHSDLNCLSVMQFATDVLQVRHIIVVGHSQCGGVIAALEDRRVGLADNWIRHVQDVRNRHATWLETLPAALRVDALCELNVVEQALNVCQTTVVQDAWQRGQELVVHGWFYGLNNGLLRDLKITVSNAAEMADAYDAAITSLHARHAIKTESVLASLGGPELAPVFTRGGSAQRP